MKRHHVTLEEYVNAYGEAVAMKTLVVVPAYGRDYASKAEVQSAWDDGRDFLMEGVMARGSYVSSRDVAILKEEGWTHVNVRYKGHTLVHRIEL